MGKFNRLGNDLYEGNVSIDFVSRRWRWYAISGVILLLAISGLVFKGLNLGVEFKGGTEMKIEVPADEANQDTVDALKVAVSETGIENASEPIVNTSGSQYILVQTKELSNTEIIDVSQVIADEVGVDAETAISTQDVGASWGKQVVNRAITGLIVFLVLVVAFIWMYFREWKMSVAAIVALLHDILITTGVYALSGFEVTPATVTGLLTILGYSLYDTVVVFDKVRENTRGLKNRRGSYTQLANLAVNQTLVRSINTSIVALLPVGAILWVGVLTLGSGSLKDLALSLFVGMAAGAYSSIFIATPVLVELKEREKEISDQERRAKAKARRAADPYAEVPSFAEDMPIQDPSGAPAGAGGFEGTEANQPRTRPAGPVAPRPSAREATGSGRTLPEAKAPVSESKSSGRNQPTRQPRSKRK